jgi:hypothetical protein
VRAPWPAEVAHLPVCPRRELPIPFIAERTAEGVANFTVLDRARAELCLAGRLCAMCSRRMGEEIALVGDAVALEPGGFWIEPPVHERCGEIATGGLCPFLSLERLPRRVQDDPTLAYVGTDAEEIAQVGRQKAKRPVVMAVTTAYQPALVASADGSAVMVYMAAAPVLRVRRFAWQAGRLAEVAGDLAASPEPVARDAEESPHTTGAPAPALVRCQRRRRSRAERRGARS